MLLRGNKRSQRKEKNSIVCYHGEVKKYDYLLIDADETILDFHGAEIRAFAAIMKLAGIPESESVYALYKKINRQMWSEVERGERSVKEIVEGQRFARLFEELKVDCSYQQANEIFLEVICNCDLVVDHALKVVETLAKTSKLYCITNGFIRTQTSRLQATGLDKYFSGIFISEAVGFEKPQFEFFEHVLKTAEISDLSRVLVIGDSLNADMQGGINCGLSTCWYNPGGLANDKGLAIDYQIKDLREIPDIAGSDKEEGVL